MERTGNKHIEDFPPAKLYLNDLQEILEVFGQTCEEVTLKTSEYENVKPSEIEELIRRLDSGKFEDLYIIGRNPYVTLDLRSPGARAYVSESSAVQLGLISQIKDILQKRKKRYIIGIGYSFVGIPQLVMFVSAARGEWVLSIVAFLFSLLMIWRAVTYQMEKTLEVYTKPKIQNESFFDRKKDDVIIALISAFAGAFFTLLLMKWLGQT